MLEWSFALAVLAIMGGAVAQRVTGMGFALLSVPFLVLAAGPIDGVVLANWCGVLAAGSNLISVRKKVEWHRVRWITPAAVVGCLPGLLLIRWVPLSQLGLVVGLITLVALLISVRSPEGNRPDTPGLRVGTGFFSGLMGVAAGVAGPPMVIYRKAVDWDVRGFAASLQFHFTVSGIAALVVKWGEGPTYSVLQWGVLLAGLVVGSVIGNRLAGRVSAKLGLRLVLVIAFAGTLSTIGRALFGMFLG